MKIMSYLRIPAYKDVLNFFEVFERAESVAKNTFWLVFIYLSQFMNN